MGERWWRDADQDPVHEAAADWFARLQDSEVTVEETVEWQRWMHADARHEQAFKRLEEAWDIARGVSFERVERAARGERDARSPWWRGAPSAIAASILFATVALWWVALWPRMFDGSSPGTLRTTIGENRSVTLADGSQITLGGNSALEVSFRESERRLELLRGEAYFIVSKDPARPFRVRAGDATVIAVGTQFNVRRGTDRVVVAVVEGRVVVEQSPSIVELPVTWLRERVPAVRLDAGQQATVGDAGVSTPASLPDQAAAAAWRSGLLSFQDEPLRYVLEDVNRYAKKPIVIGDEDIGALRITGTVVNKDVGEWITSLESAFELRAVEEPERIVLRRGM